LRIQGKNWKNPTNNTLVYRPRIKNGGREKESWTCQEFQDWGVEVKRRKENTPQPRRSSPEKKNKTRIHFASISEEGP